MDFKEATCHACLSRECCYHFGIDLTGADIYRISRTLRLPATEFVVVYRTEKRGSALAFALNSSEERYKLGLRRKDDGREKTPCQFLIELESGRTLCGLGDTRPDACKIFPVIEAPFPDSGLVNVYRGPGCWRQWHIGELDLDREAQQMRSRAKAVERYREHLEAWNRTVTDIEPSHYAPLETLLSFLMNRYAASEEGERHAS